MSRAFKSDLSITTAFSIYYYYFSGEDNPWRSLLFVVWLHKGLGLRSPV
jgi:hypothetical protein